MGGRRVAAEARTEWTHGHIELHVTRNGHFHPAASPKKHYK
jgi:hypothetical protein